VCGQSDTPPALTLEKIPSVPTEQEAGWARDLVWKPWRSEKSLDPASNLTSITHSLSGPWTTNHTNCTITANLLETVLSWIYVF